MFARGDGDGDEFVVDESATTDVMDIFKGIFCWLTCRISWASGMGACCCFRMEANVREMWSMSAGE